jgi:hypothetical protein
MFNDLMSSTDLGLKKLASFFCIMKHHYLIIKILSMPNKNQDGKGNQGGNDNSQRGFAGMDPGEHKRIANEEGWPLMKKVQDMNGIARKQEKLVKKVVNLLAVETVAVNY